MSDQKNKNSNPIIIGILAAALAAVAVFGFIKIGDVADDVTNNTEAVGKIDSMIKDANSAFLDAAGIDARIDDKIKTALADGGAIATAIKKGDEATLKSATAAATAKYDALLTQVTSEFETTNGRVSALDVALTATSAGSLRHEIAAAKIAATLADDRAMTAQRALWGKKKGLVAAVTTLAERSNAKFADDADVAEAAAKTRAEMMSRHDAMLAAVQGLDAKAYAEAQKKAPADRSDIAKLRINIEGDRAKDERIVPDATARR